MMNAMTTPENITHFDESNTNFLENQHKKDNLILLIYVILSIISVLTIWFFNHRRFKYIHSSGLFIIYGLIAGAALRWGYNPDEVKINEFSPPDNETEQLIESPQKLILKLIFSNNDTKFKNRVVRYLYNFERQTESYKFYDDSTTVNPEIFFNIILPPIIFYAGYSMKRRHFFRNFGAIITYAFLGTALSAFFVASFCFFLTRMIASISESLNFSDCLLFGCMISATDPVTVLAIFNELSVDSDLYALVFGESILNDAIAIAMSQSVEKFSRMDVITSQSILRAILHFFVMISTSFSIGSIIAILTALLTKFTRIRDFPILETTLFVLMSYSTFLIAEAAGYTGIVAVLFCGILQAHYTYNNLSKESKAWTKEFFELLNFLAENFIFAYIGVSTFTFRYHLWHVGFIVITIIACALARAFNIYSVSCVINLVRRFQSNGCLGRCNNKKDNSSLEPDILDDISEDVDGQDYTSTTHIIKPSSNNKLGLIPFNQQHMLFFSGLRGAMAFSLALRNATNPIRQMFFSTTIIIVMITVFLCGCLSTTVLHFLKIKTGEENKAENYFKPEETSKVAQENDKCTREKTGCWKLWTEFDKRFMKPLLTHSIPSLETTLPAGCLRVSHIFTTYEQRACEEEAYRNNRIQEEEDAIFEKNKLSNGFDKPEKSDFLNCDELNRRYVSMD